MIANAYYIHEQINYDCIYMGLVQIDGTNVQMPCALIIVNDPDVQLLIKKIAKE